ncbi:MAG: LPP20 family lipoprotein, partial [Myxococcales bacterium]
MTVLALLALTVSAAAAPDWVDTGRSARFPRERYLTAVASAESLESAKTAAAGELARSISVRIESQMSDLMTLKNGVDSQEIAVFSRASSDVRLTGLTYETFQKGERAHALAVLERAVAGAEERR